MLLFGSARAQPAHDPASHGAHAAAVGQFTYDRKPLIESAWPSWQHPINRDRVYDFYAKQAEFFMRQSTLPMLLPAFPGLDGGKQGHWGNQNEQTWADDRWNGIDVGEWMCGGFREGKLKIARSVCVRLGDAGELAVCFDTDTCRYVALWADGFLQFSSVRHGFLDGLRPAGRMLSAPPSRPGDAPVKYRGFYRHGRRVVFAYRLGDVEMLDSPWVEGGKFVAHAGPAESHPLKPLTTGGPARWPQVLETRGQPATSHTGPDSPYVVDTIQPPFDNPWKALLFFGDHDFFPDGRAAVSTMQGDVWLVDGLDESLTCVKWKRFASGLHQPLGLRIVDGKVMVMGRDQMTRLHDLNGDGEADFHERFTAAYDTAANGHDFITGLQRDAAGNFYAASNIQGVIRISPDGSKVESLATGFRNPDGIGLMPDGSITVPCSEGDWTPASMICQIRPGGHYGAKGPRNNQPPDLPLVYLPRGLDNSSGGQTAVTSDRWGPLQGQMLHFSYGGGAHFLVLRQQVGDQWQGAVVPLPGEFLSGAHRGRFSPVDGQLYVSGMQGWGSYTPHDGSFQRVRYTGKPAQLPVGFAAHRNGVMLRFARPVDPAVASDVKNHFAQAWNYRYSAAYGSAELSPSLKTLAGHDPWAVTAAHVAADRLSVFLEIPQLQPVNQLHLHSRVDGGAAHDLFLTVHALAETFTDYPGYKPMEKIVAPHPILADMASAHKARRNPFAKFVPESRLIVVEAGKNLTFATTSFTVRAGEKVKLNFVNPDVVPHNWVLVKPDTLATVGDLCNKFIADPDAVYEHYVPRSDLILVHTDVVSPQESAVVYFTAPKQPGIYPYLCSFPGHWMVMNGRMIVE
jgi:azurin